MVCGVHEVLQGAVAPECGRDVSSSLWSKLVAPEAASEGADKSACHWLLTIMKALIRR